MTLPNKSRHFPESEDRGGVFLPRIGMERKNSAETEISSSHSGKDSLGLVDLDDIESDIEEWNLVGSQGKAYGELSEDEEREIHLKVKDKMKYEFRRIYLEARSRQELVRKRFTSVINDARSALIAARIEAEKVSINKLEEKAEEKQAEIQKNRTSRKKQQEKTHGTSAHARVTKHKYVDTNKLLAEEIGILRKIQSDLDRARARRKYSVAAAMTTKNGKVKVLNLLQTEVRRLEKDEEVHELVIELKELDLHEHACKLSRAIRAKEESERRLREKLTEERLNAHKKALRRLEEEKSKMRQKRWTEKEREERERIEREKMEKVKRERERLQRIMTDLKRKARNMEFQKSFEAARFTTRLSRSFSYSYF